MKTHTSESNTTVIRATLSRDEYELILAEAVLLDAGRTLPDSAYKVSVGEMRNARSGSIAPGEYVLDIEIMIDNTKLPLGVAGG